MSKITRCISSLLLILVWDQGLAEALTGEVVRVVDGDTQVVLSAGKAQHKIRLAGIDAPEMGQPYGRSWKSHSTEWVAGRFVVLDWHKRDRYGRVVGKALLSGEDMGLEQVEAGLAWHYKKYAGEPSRADRKAYARAEEEARKARRVLWAEPETVPP